VGWQTRKLNALASVVHRVCVHGALPPIACAERIVTATNKSTPASGLEYTQARHGCVFWDLLMRAPRAPQNVTRLGVDSSPRPLSEFWAMGDDGAAPLRARARFQLSPRHPSTAGRSRRVLERASAMMPTGSRLAIPRDLDINRPLARVAGQS
jgi:hypothetical protein